MCLFYRARATYNSTNANFLGNKPASVLNETTSLELSPVILEINSHASDFSCQSNPIISPTISFLIDDFG